MPWIMRNDTLKYVRDEEVRATDKKIGASARVQAEIVSEKKAEKPAKKSKKKASV